MMIEGFITIIIVIILVWGLWGWEVVVHPSKTHRNLLREFNEYKVMACNMLAEYQYELRKLQDQMSESDTCKGCGKELVIENAWMFDGCPCNSHEGINDLNKRRWRLLWELQQRQSRELEDTKRERDELQRMIAEDCCSKIEANQRIANAQHEAAVVFAPMIDELKAEVERLKKEANYKDLPESEGLR